MHIVRVAALIAALFAVHGCAAIAVTAGGLAGGAGVDHTMNGISYKTFSTSMPKLRLATLKALNKMAMDVTADEKTEKGWKIEAKATERKINIAFESLTKRATRMRVIVDKGQWFLKDAATGNEIIIMTAETLRRQSARTRTRK